MINKVQSAKRIVKQGRLDGLLYLLKERWKSELISFGLRRDLTVPFAAPDPKIPLSIRPLEEDDISKILDTNAPGITDEEREERMTRLQMLDAGIRTCYVAVTADNTPCFMQWLIRPGENSKMQLYFKGIFPPLAPDEALLEGAFTPEAFRGKGIMSWAMARLVEQEAGLGPRFAITFVTRDNIPSLKGCKKAGFAPYLTRIEKWGFFLRQVTFTPLPDGTPYPFDL